jgi:hypothetical protein
MTCGVVPVTFFCEVQHDVTGLWTADVVLNMIPVTNCVSEHQSPVKRPVQQFVGSIAAMLEVTASHGCDCVLAAATAAARPHDLEAIFLNGNV